MQHCYMLIARLARLSFSFLKVAESCLWRIVISPMIPKDSNPM
jgi:hypothetical protein